MKILLIISLFATFINQLKQNPSLTYGNVILYVLSLGSIFVCLMLNIIG